MTAEDIIQEVLIRIADIIIHGGNTPQKIVVSEKVYDSLLSIKLMPRSLRYENSQFFIADIPVEKKNIDYGVDKDVWFQIV